MHSTLKKLIGYSTSAAAFLTCGQEIEAQVVYNNIDPDIIISGTDSVAIDFNDDGDIDIYIHFDLSHQSSDWYYFIEIEDMVSIYIDQFYGVINNEDHQLEFGAQNLNPGFLINEIGPWNDTDKIELLDLRRKIQSDDTIPWLYDVHYSDWSKQNQFIGVKFTLDSQNYYGWIRLSIDDLSKYSEGLPKLIVQDYAFESEEESPLLIKEVSASIAEYCRLLDYGESLNATDFHISFNKAHDESTISAYRVFIYMNTPLDLTPPSVNILEDLNSERYVEIIPNGDSIYQLQLPEGFLDMNGIPLNLAYNGYRAIILSVADGVNAIYNNVSIPSNSDNLETDHTYAPSELTIYETGDDCSIRDFTVTFNKSPTEFGIDEYRIFVLNDDFKVTGNYNLNLVETLLELSSEYYYTVEPTNNELYTVEFNLTDKIAEEEEPILFQHYYTALVTIGDSILATDADFKSTIYAEDADGEEIGQEVEYYCTSYFMRPIVMIDDTATTTNNVHVKFDGPDKKNGLKEYRIYIVPAEDEVLYNMVDLLNMPEENYFKINRSEEFDVQLPLKMRDVYGNYLLKEKEYQVIVGLLDESYDVKFALSLPSIAFSIRHGLHPGLFDPYVFNDILHINNPYLEQMELTIINIIGEKVLYQNLPQGNHHIDLHHLHKGVYLINYANSTIQKSTTIFIGNSNY